MAFHFFQLSDCFFRANFWLHKGGSNVQVADKNAGNHETNLSKIRRALQSGAEPCINVPRAVSIYESADYSMIGASAKDCATSDKNQRNGMKSNRRLGS